jgi:hypothetical protein
MKSSNLVLKNPYSISNTFTSEILSSTTTNFAAQESETFFRGNHYV